MSQDVTPDHNEKSVMSESNHNENSVTPESTPEAIRQKAYRDRVKRAGEMEDRVKTLESELESLRSEDRVSFRLAVKEFTQLKDSLHSKLSDLESNRRSLEIGEAVLSDPDLVYLVETMWLKSASQQDRLRNHVRSYRQSLRQ